MKGQSIPVLDKGFVQLIDWMGSDREVCDAARVSYGEGTKSLSDDTGLIRYLMRHRHTTPFEMCEVKFRVKVPMDTWRQWIRHRTANVNEYSTRYSIAIDEKQETTEWRAQSGTNKQGSVGLIPDEWSENNFTQEIISEFPSTQIPSPQEYLSLREKAFHVEAQILYEERLKLGVAREQARKDLPLSTYTVAYWKCDLHNIFNFLSLRMDSHAQEEIRAYANVIGERFIKVLFPICWEAFKDYRLQSVSFSRLEIEALKSMLSSTILAEGRIEKGCEIFTNKREKEEFLKKIERIL